jgi:hypothetical protein
MHSGRLVAEKISQKNDLLILSNFYLALYKKFFISNKHSKSSKKTKSVSFLFRNNDGSTAIKFFVLNNDFHF